MLTHLQEDKKREYEAEPRYLHKTIHQGTVLEGFLLGMYFHYTNFFFLPHFWILLSLFVLWCSFFSICVSKLVEWVECGEPKTSLMLYELFAAEWCCCLYKSVTHKETATHKTEKCSEEKGIEFCLCDTLKTFTQFVLLKRVNTLYIELPRILRLF